MDFSNKTTSTSYAHPRFLGYLGSLLLTLFLTAGQVQGQITITIDNIVQPTCTDPVGGEITASFQVTSPPYQVDAVSLPAYSETITGIMSDTTITFPVMGAIGEGVVFILVTDDNSATNTQPVNMAIVEPVLTVPGTPIEVCDNSGPQALVPLVTVDQGGGTLSFSGPGVSGPLPAWEFDPTGQNGTIDIDVTYTLGVCMVMETFQYQVTPLPVADFEYTFTPFCQSEPDPTPTFLNGGTAGTFSAVPAGLVINPATGEVDLSASTPGNYTVTNTIAASGGCPVVSFNAPIEVVASAVADFEYSASPYCSNDPNQFPAFLNGGVAGTFSAAPAGLVFADVNTGEIDIASSTAGTYTITNTIAAAGPCPMITFNAPVEITQLPVADFEYSTTPYCDTDVDPTPTFLNGGVAGAFSALPAGLVIDMNTGLVDLSASTPGVYTVTNTIAAVGGCPVVTFNAPIEVTAMPVADFEYSTTPYCSDDADPVPTFLNGGVAGTFSAVPAGLVFVDMNTGEVDLSASTPGVYTVTNTIAAVGGCAVVTFNSLIEITLAPVADFEYSSSPYCSNDPNQFPAFLNGGMAGTFTAVPAGLSIDMATGEVDISASTPGTYTVTNTIAAGGGCTGAVFNAPITITDLPEADFEYSASPYCSSDPNQLPTFLGGGIAGTFSAVPGGLVFADANTGEIDIAASTPGVYTVTNTIAASGGCPVVTFNAPVEITAQPVADFEYSATPYCDSDADPAPTFLNGGVAGTFTAAPAGLSINMVTGLVDLSASTPGVYTVTNTLSAVGGCPIVTFDAPIEITAEPVADFEYSATPYCSDDTDPLPTFLNSGVAGTFSAVPAGLVFLDVNTGEVDLSASTPGNYTVTNTIATSGGCPVVTFNALIDITLAPVADFEFSASPYCSNDPNQFPTFLNGGMAGTFTAVPAGLVIDMVTGEVDIAASTPGTYTVTNTIAGGGGCGGVAFGAPITITELPEADFEYSSSPYCGNDPDQLPTFLGGGVSGTFSAVPAGLVFVDVNTGEIDIVASTPGVYTVTNTIAASGGCGVVNFNAPMEITAVPVAEFEYSATPYCDSDADPSPTFLNGGVAGTFTAAPAGLSIDMLTGIVDLSSSTAGVYTVTNTIAAAGGCPVVTFNAPIEVTALPEADFEYSGTPYCTTDANPLPNFLGGGVAGTFSAAPAGLVFVDVNTGQVDLAASTPGAYTVTNTIAAGGGCPVVTFNAPIQITALPVADFEYANSPFCSTDPNPFPDFLNGGIAGTFSAAPAGLVFVSNATGEVDISASTPGMYVVTNTIAASGGCGAVMFAANIDLSSPVTVDVINSTNSSCNAADDGTITFTTVSGGTMPYQYSIDNGTNYQAGNSFGSLAPQAYVLIARDANGCESSPSPELLTEPDAITITVDLVNDPTTCGAADGEIFVTPSGGSGTFTSFLWSPGGQTTEDISGITAGIYSVTVTDDQGCMGTSANIPVNDPVGATITIDNITPVSCAGGSDGAIDVTLSGGTMPYSSTVWSNGSTMADLVAVPAGSYDLTVTDGMGCVTTSANNVVTEPTPVTVSLVLTIDPTCFGGSDGRIEVLASGGTGPYEYQINGAGFTPNGGIFTGLSAGTFTIEAQDVNSCPGTLAPDPVLVDPASISPALSSSAPGNTICTGDNVTFTATPAGADNYIFFVDGVAAQNSGMDQFNTTTLTDGQVVTVEVMIATCSELSAGIATTVITLPTLMLTQDNVGQCPGAPVTLSGTPGYDTYEFRDGVGGTVLRAADPNNQFTSSGFTDGQIIEIEAVSASCGTFTATVTVSVNAAPVLNLTQDAPGQCPGAPVTLSATTGFDTYEFRDGVGGTVLRAADPNSQFTSNAFTDGQIIEVQAISAVCGTFTETVTVSISPTPTLSLTQDAVGQCPGASVTLTATGGFDTYEFRAGVGGTTLQGPGAASQLTSSTLTNGQIIEVEAVSAACGTFTATAVVSINATPTLTLVQDAVGQCPGASVTLTASTGFDSYEFRDGIGGTPLAGSSASNQFTSTAFTNGQIIEVEATSAVCGVFTANVGVVINPAPVLSLSQDTVTCLGENVTISATAGFDTYEFRNGVGGATLQGPSADSLFTSAALTDGQVIEVEAISSVCGTLTNTLTVSMLAANDPLCDPGGLNCGVFTVSIDTLNLVRPTCITPDNGAVTFFVSGGSGNYNFVLTDSASFSQGLTGPGPFVYSSLSAAQYYYFVDDGVNTCTLPFTLDQETRIEATASNFGDAVCFGDSTGMATINTTGFSGGFVEYSYDNGLNYFSVIPGNQVSNLPPNGTYTVLVRDDATDACPDSTQVTINNAHPEINLDLQTTAAGCTNNDGQIEVLSVSGGLPPYSFILDSVVYSTLPPGGVFDSLTAGNYVLIVEDAATCSKQYDVVIPGANIFTFTTTPIAPGCSGGQTGSIILQIDSAFLPGNYQAGITQDSMSTPAFQPVPSDGRLPFTNLDEGQYFIAVQEVGACQFLAVEVLAGGGVPVDFDLQVVCSEDGQAVVLTNITGESGSPLVVEIFDLGSVDPVDTIGLSDIPSSATLLIDEGSFLEVPGGYSLRIVQSQSTCNYISEGQTFRIEPELSAAIGDTTISLPDQPTGSITLTEVMGGYPDYVSRIELINPVFPGQNFLTDWDTIQFNPEKLVYEVVYEGLFAGEYLIEVMDSAGCYLTFDVDLDFDRTLFIPNVFTPNNDGVNDILYIRNLPEGNVLTISNRWGKVVFEASDYQNDWDGDSNAEGVYFYSLTVPGGEQSYTGWIEIVRGDQ